MEEKAFNLLEEPWIWVIDCECNKSEVSLKDLFKKAHEFTALCGELPTQDFAVMRVLLAILHTVFSRYSSEGEESGFKTPDDALDRWEELWQMKRFPEKPILEYLESQHEKFWLFHPDRPFYQTNAAKIGTQYSAAKLNGNLSESNNKLRLFPMVSGEKKGRLSFAEAARWLIYVNAYDDTSAKPSSESKKDGKLPSPGAGWLGKLGMVTINGDNLFETLMLNLVMLDQNGGLYPAEKPIWEREVVPSGERVEIPLPDNLSELYTLQSRRLLLKKLNDKVSGYYLLGGDFFEKENSLIEPMTMWFRAKSKTDEIYTPCRHDPSKQFWRNFGAVIPKSDQSHKRPGVVSWINLLEDEEILENDFVFEMKTASVQYGDKDFFVANVFSDSFSFHGTLLSESNVTWQNAVIDCIQFCDELSGYIWSLARKINLSVGGDDETSKTYANHEKSRFYHMVDEPFRRWIFHIIPKTDDTEEKQKEWRKNAIKIARKQGNTMVQMSGEQAIFGKSKKQKEKDKRESYSAAEAMNEFLWKLGQAERK